MERSPLLDSQVLESSSPEDMTQRLQKIISTWRGAEAGESLLALHEQCLQAAGRGSKLLPAHLLFVEHLDATTLQTALRRLNGVGRHTKLTFRVPPFGRFDAALVPVGKVGALPDRFILALETLVEGGYLHLAERAFRARGTTYTAVSLTRKGQDALAGGIELPTSQDVEGKA